MGFESLSRNLPSHAGFEDRTPERRRAETDTEPILSATASENACTRAASGPLLDRLIFGTLAATILVLIIGLLIAPRPATAAPWQHAAATWYGPGFYGNTTACGQRYSIHIRGVAVPSAGPRHMRCGTRVTICRRGRCVRVRVIDTGGFRNHQFDLSARTAMDLCHCWRPYTMRVRWAKGWRR